MLIGKTSRHVTPIYIKHAAALAALIRLFNHRIIDWHGQQFTAVWTFHFCRACDGAREAEFVGDDVVEEGHYSSSANDGCSREMAAVILCGSPYPR